MSENRQAPSSCSNTFSLQESVIYAHRTTLMGIATFSVFLAHVLHRFTNDLPGDIIPACFLYTYGFLFLSGFSIYYSLANREAPNWSGRILPFYRRRITKVFIPFIISSFIPIIILSAIDNASFAKVLLRLSSFNFWFEGNTCGTWYVSAILPLYLFSPLLYKFKQYLGLLSIIAFFLVLIFQRIYPGYYQKIHFVEQLPLFLVGMAYAAYFTRNPQHSQIYIICLISVLTPFFIFTKKYFIIESIVGIIAIFIFANIIANIRRPKKMLQWMGNNSLILYLLHLELCFILQNVGVDSQIAIILSIISAIVLCPLCNRAVSWTTKQLLYNARN